MTRTTAPRPIGCSLQQLFLLLLLLVGPSLAPAQDAIRPSLAGEAASEARRQDIDRIPYNLLVGPVRFRFGVTFGIEYNDNINLSQNDERKDDIILRPQLNFNAIWPITQLNTLRLDLGIGYAAYMQHSENNTNGLLIAPGTQLAFDIFVGDFRINIHDRMSLRQDPITEGSLSGVSDYGRFENTAGVSVLWDLNKVLVTVGYDHYTFLATNDDFEYLDRNSEMFNASVSVAVASTTNIGAEGSYSYNYYDENIMNDSNSASAGGFVESQITNYLRFRVGGGYQWIDFDDNGLIPDTNDLSDWYAYGLISNRLSAVLTQSVSAGHESQLGVNSNYIVLNYVRHTIAWNLIRDTLFTTEFFYEDGDDSGGFIDEHFQRYGAAATLGYQLTPHVTLGLRYQYTQKESDVPGRNYIQNRVLLDGTYSF